MKVQAASELAQWVKELAAKSEELSSIPTHQVIERQPRTMSCLSSDIHRHCGTHTHTHAHNSDQWSNKSTNRYWRTKWKFQIMSLTSRTPACPLILVYGSPLCTELNRSLTTLDCMSTHWNLIVLRKEALIRVKGQSTSQHVTALPKFNQPL